MVFICQESAVTWLQSTLGLGKGKGKGLVKVVGNEACVQVRNNLIHYSFQRQKIIISRDQNNMIKAVIWKENQ